MGELIYLVDDDPVVNMVHTKILKYHDDSLVIKVFRSGQSALEALLDGDQSMPSLIVLDINMPMVTGWELMDEILAKGMEVKVIIVTSSVDVDDLNRSKRYPQIVNYIPKPLTMTNSNAIMEVLKSR